MVAVILMVTTMTGCMVHGQRGVSSNLVSYLYPDGKPVNHAADQIPHLKLPLRVGIAFIPEASADFNQSLTAVEKDRLLEGVAKKFKQRPYVQSIEIIPEIYMRQGKGFNTVTQIAALHNLDVMALVSYDHVQSSEENALSLAYWTIVGAYIVPGETTQAQTFVDTAVFDVTTKKLLFRAPGAASDSKMHSAMSVGEKSRKLRNKTFDEAMGKMSMNLERELGEFKARVKEEKIATVSYRKGYSGGGSYGWWGLGFLVLLVGFSREKS